MNKDITIKFMKLVLFGLLIIMDGQKSCRSTWVREWERIEKNFISELDEA